MLAVEFEVIATASDGKSALDLVRRYERNVIGIAEANLSQE